MKGLEKEEGRQLRQHEKHRSRSAEVTYCLSVLVQLKRHECAGPFLCKVDPVAELCLDYFLIVKEPMDLSTVEAMLKEGTCSTRNQFAALVRKIWSNSLLFNKPETKLYHMTRKISKFFERIFDAPKKHQQQKIGGGGGGGAEGGGGGGSCGASSAEPEYARSHS